VLRVRSLNEEAGTRVLIPVVTEHYTMLAGNLLYTGVTRGKRLVVLIAVRGGNMKRRWTKLREWLASAGIRKAAGDGL
jgi:hypothetical protein